MAGDSYQGDEDSLVVSVVFEGVDLDMLLEMMRAGGTSTPAAAIKAALHRHAAHLGLNPGMNVFSLERRPKRQKEAPCKPAERSKQ